MWRRGDTRHLLLLGLWVTADLRPLVASARTAVQSFATGECAASAAQAIIGLACWTAAATRLELSLFFCGWVDGSTRWRSGGDWKRSRGVPLMASPKMGPELCRQQVGFRLGSLRLLPAQNAAPAHLYNRINRKLKASINLNRLAEAQTKPRRNH